MPHRANVHTILKGCPSFVAESLKVSTSLSPDLCRAFRGLPDSAALFLSRGCLSALEQLERATVARLPIILLTAAPGTGKTVLIRHFVERQPVRPGTRAVYFDQSTDGDLTAYLADMLRTLQQGSSTHQLLVVDDAQSLSAPQQQLVVRTHQAAQEGGNSASLILIGHDNLLPAVKSWHGDMRADCHEVHLAPLTPDEVSAYLRRRLDTIGFPQQDDIPFESEALRLLFDLSEGVPRFLDHFAERALYEAAQDRRTHVDAELLRDSLLDTSLVDVGWPSTRPGWTNRKPAAPAPQPAAAISAPEGLRADPAESILDRKPNRRGKTTSLIALTVILGTAAGGLYYLWDNGALPAWTENLQEFAGQTVEPPDEAATTFFNPAPAHEFEDPVVSSPGLPRPSAVMPEPDPTQLMRDALVSEAVDIDEARRLYELAALLGNGRAAYFLGQLLEVGGAIPRDLPRAQAWYSVAAGIEGAERRRAALAELPPGDGPTAAPVPNFHAILPSGLVALFWRNAEGQPPQRYLVEYVPAGKDGTVVATQTTLSATLLDSPVTRWRITSLDNQGRSAGASDWSYMILPPR